MFVFYKNNLFFLRVTFGGLNRGSQISEKDSITSASVTSDSKFLLVNLSGSQVRNQQILKAEPFLIRVFFFLFVFF